MFDIVLVYERLVGPAGRLFVEYRAHQLVPAASDLYFLFVRDFDTDALR